MKKELEKLVNGKRSVIFSGNTLVGKTYDIGFSIVDSIIKNEESFFIVDKNKEYYNRFKKELDENNYNIIVLNLSEPYLGDGFNPYSLVYDLYNRGLCDNALSLLDLIHNKIFYTSDAVDPFWDTSAANLASGIALSILEKYDSDYLNINNIFNIINSLDNEDGKKYIDLFKDNSRVMSYLEPILLAPIETRGGIFSVARQKLRLYASRSALSCFLSKTSFNFNDFDNKSAIFVNVSGEINYLSSLVNILIEEINVYNHIYNKFKMNYILDNFDFLDNDKYLSNLLEFNDYRKSKFYVFTRSIARIKDVKSVYYETLATIVKVKEDVLEINYSDDEQVMVDKEKIDEIYYQDEEICELKNSKDIKLIDLKEV